MRLSLIFFISIVAWPTLSAQTIPWSDGTARPLPQGRYEFGILHTPVRYGVTDDLELSSYLLWDVLIPGIEAKKYLGSHAGWQSAVSVGLSSPTPMLRFLATQNNGLLLPPDTYVPWFAVVHSSIQFSHALYNEHIATLTGDVSFAFSIADRSSEYPAYQRLQTIDYPFIFSRTAFLTKTPNLQPCMGVGFDGPVFGPLAYSIAWNYSLIPLHDNLREENLVCWSLESSASVTWHISPSFSLQGGMIYSKGSYAFGKNWVVYPTLDIIFGCGNGTSSARQ